MATRQDVLDGIATINDGGNNTATEVRDVLKLLFDKYNSLKLLNCNISVGNVVKPFSAKPKTSKLFI